jgi:tetraacyldisaccharide 4'-kinase
VYLLLIQLRNSLFDWNILKSKQFNFPVISVGNLKVGGVGKTPHIEYLIRLLQNDFKIATLSRGYKRKTKGFILATKKSDIDSIGDEPLQYSTKFDKITVAVDEKRVKGIQKLKELQPNINVVLLDDAFQHRWVKPSLNILITDVTNLYINDFVLPSGRLREMASGSKRADIIIVSKTDKNLTLEKQNKIHQLLKPKKYQKLYFSYVDYGVTTPFTTISKSIINTITANSSVLLLTGIANPIPLFEHLKASYQSVKQLNFKDHHNFNISDIETIKNALNNIDGNNKIIITTEKDIMRLSLPKILNIIQDIPIFYIPIEIKFHGDNKQDFDNQIIEHVKSNTGN